MLSERRSGQPSASTNKTASDTAVAVRSSSASPGQPTVAIRASHPHDGDSVGVAVAGVVGTVLAGKKVLATGVTSISSSSDHSSCRREGGNHRDGTNAGIGNKNQ